MPAPLLDALKDPAAAAGLGPEAWETLLRQARVEKLHARIAAMLLDRGLLDRVVEPVRRRLGAYATMSEAHDRGARWEVDRIAAALKGLDTPVVLLKGAAYLMSGLGVARGRLTEDVDILVPKARIGAVEAALVAHGWEPLKVDPYDQKYYRRYMHEIPPLRHARRHATVDVHHTILPETSRLRPDAAELIRAAIPLPGAPGIHVLRPTDMVLHGSAHLFHDGSLEGGLRDLVDLDDLLRHFARDPSFWTEILPRARRLDLGRPLFYTLRYASRLFGTPVPATALAAAQEHRPNRLALALMDRLVPAALIPSDPDRPSGGFERWLLYVRSHWLRMPPHLLASHLATKAVKRLFGKPS
jgi:hypothetical protein